MVFEYASVLKFAFLYSHNENKASKKPTSAHPRYSLKSIKNFAAYLPAASF
jgi:hypothetical protein